MNISTPSVIRQLLFGFDDQRWLLRCDTWHQAAHDLSPFDALHIEFVQPTDYVLRLEKLNQRRPEVTLIHQGRTLTEVHLEAAIGHILECALPLSILRLQAGDLVEFYVLLFQKGMNTDRLPREGLISLTCPPPDYEYIMWQA